MAKKATMLIPASIRCFDLPVYQDACLKQIPSQGEAIFWQGPTGKTYDPVTKEHLWVDFYNLPNDQEILEFARKHGPLGLARYPMKREPKELTKDLKKALTRRGWVFVDSCYCDYEVPDCKAFGPKEKYEEGEYLEHWRREIGPFQEAVDIMFSWKDGKEPTLDENILVGRMLTTRLFDTMNYSESYSPHDLSPLEAAFDISVPCLLAAIYIQFWLTFSTGLGKKVVRCAALDCNRLVLKEHGKEKYCCRRCRWRTNKKNRRQGQGQRKRAALKPPSPQAIPQPV